MDMSSPIETLFVRLNRVEDDLTAMGGIGYKLCIECDNIFVNYGTILRNIEYENTRLYCINSMSRNFYDMSDVDIKYFPRQSGTWH